MEAKKNTREFFRRRLKFTWLKFFVIMVAIAGCLSLLVVSRGNASEGYYFVRQLCWFLGGSFLLFIVSAIDLDISKKDAGILYVGGVSILFFVLLLGVRVNGMRGWFKFFSLGIQPSELLKPIFVLVFARLWKDGTPSSGKYVGGLCSLLLLAPWLLLLLLQPDAGTALIYCVTFLAMLWVGGVGTMQLLLAGISFIPVAGLALWRYPYMRRRLEAFLNASPEVLQTGGWHAAVMANSLQNGGWFGKLLNPDPTLNQVPYRANDSIFAVLSEQLGFIGMLPLVLLLFSWLAFCCVRAARSNSRYHQLIFVGCGVMLSGQAMLHLAVNLGLFPTTGITFPLISYGGSSLFATMIMAGIVDSICRQEKKITE